MKPKPKPDAELAAVKAYMRVDHDMEDALIASLLAAARDYLTRAGVERSDENGARYDLALWGLTLNYYDNRSADAVGVLVSPLSYGLRGLITQLKHDGGAEG